MNFPKPYLSLLNILQESPFLIVVGNKYEKSYYLIKDKNDWNKYIPEIYKVNKNLGCYNFTNNFIKDIELADSQDKKVFCMYQLLKNRSDKGYEYEEFDIEYFSNHDE